VTGAYSDSSPVAVTWIRPLLSPSRGVYVGMQTSLGYDGTSSDEVPSCFRLAAGVGPSLLTRWSSGSLRWNGARAAWRC
jgi:hypothetical protein